MSTRNDRRGELCSPKEIEKASTCCTRGGGFCEAKDGRVKIKYNLFTKYVEKRM